MNKNRASKKALDVRRRQLEALELRKQGLGYQAIADRLGYKNVSSAYQAVQAILKATLREPADELRRIEAERLDSLMTAVYRRAQDGDEKALDRVLRVMERRARLLGLDQGVPDPVALDLRAALDATRAAARAYRDPDADGESRPGTGDDPGLVPGPSEPA